MALNKPASEWYTPNWLFGLIRTVFESNDIYDPCPAAPSPDGLCTDWTTYRHVYCNPPIPAAVWANKALNVVERRNNETVVIFAAFSPSVLFQEPRLLYYPTCYVRKRIAWIDGRKEVKDRTGQLISNPNYLKSDVGSNAYSAFVLLGGDREYRARFKGVFSAIGEVPMLPRI